MVGVGVVEQSINVWTRRINRLDQTNKYFRVLAVIRAWLSSPRRRQQLPPNQPYISPLSHNSPTMGSLSPSSPSSSSSRRGNTHLGPSLLHPPPSNRHPPHHLSPSHRYQTIPTQILKSRITSTQANSSLPTHSTFVPTTVREIRSAQSTALLPFRRVGCIWEAARGFRGC